MAMTCDKVMDSLPHVKWSQAISPMLTALRETCIKDISDRMAPMIASFHFRHLANVRETPQLFSDEYSKCYDDLQDLVRHFYPWPPLAPTRIVVCPCVCPFVCPKQRYHTNSLRISAISLKFGRMMHSTMKHIAVDNGDAWSIFLRTTELWNFPR